MSRFAARVAARFLNAGFRGTWEFLSNESKGVVLGAWVYHLRQSLNGRPGTVYMSGRPKPTKVVLVDDDGTPRLQLIGFAVPDVGFVDYDHERRQVRVLSRSGTVLSKEDVRISFDLTVSALKKAGKDLAYHSSVLLGQMRRELASRAEPVSVHWAKYLESAISGLTGVGGMRYPAKVTPIGDAAVQISWAGLPLFNPKGKAVFDGRTIDVFDRSTSVFQEPVPGGSARLTPEQLGKVLADTLLSAIPTWVIALDEDNADDLASAAKQHADDIAANASVNQILQMENQWATSFYDYIGTARRRSRTIDGGRDGGPWQTSNTTVEQNYIDIGPWLESAGFSARAFGKALPQLSDDVMDTIQRALAPGYVKDAPINYSNFKVGFQGTDLTLTYKSTIYYN
jgi:hypothetical protein